jgi:hypothetical protein
MSTIAMAESQARVWVVAVSPVIWALHFMACYVLVALWCGMVVGRDGSLLTARIIVAGLTLVALAAVGGIGWRGYRAHSLGRANAPHDDDTPEDRHRFLGFATLLLSGLSAVAIVYSALTVAFVTTCQ